MVGIPVMRFDYRGMGDSQGDQISFEETGPDIKAAVDAFMSHCPDLERIVLWGLCDAASACLMVSVSDKRVRAMALVNPWVRTEAGIAKAHLKHYYTTRFFEKEFWLKILKCDFNYLDAFRSILRQIKNVFFSDEKLLPFQKKMERALSDFTGKILFIISGNDLTAAEFKDLVNSSAIWKQKIQEQNIEWHNLADADHTFSRTQWKAQVSDITIKWIKQHYA
jgi:exosortase A-associated hydrolase 1